VRDVLDAIDAAGIRKHTTILIVADHGFIAIPNTLQPDVALRQAGLLTVEGNQIATARAQVIPEGGIGMLYLTAPGHREADREKVRELFRDREGIAGILMPSDFARYGLPQPDEYPQMADLILVAKEGYGFGATATGDEFVVKSDATVGNHGFLSTNPRMNAIFVASGAGLQHGTKLPAIENIDVAPTIAKLLGVPLPTAAGRVLVEALVEAVNGPSS
jgi:predicted AlkP superfamily pyrophosphatase or phosphodiesterase